MSRLVNVLFPAPSIRRSPLAVIAWWEARRLTYNVAVGAAGLVTLAVADLLVTPAGHFVPLPLVLAYGVMANVCYTLGPVGELLLQRWLGRETYGLGPALFRHGLVFAVGLTLFPIGVACMVGVARLITMLGGVL